MKEAMLWEKLSDGKIRCRLCAHACLIPPGKKGICRVRENVAGRLVTHTYGKLVAAHADPIEKKPLFHFLPGSISYSIATPGCNFTCRHCQNAAISQAPRETDRVTAEFVPPEIVVENALAHRSRSISYTYTEPTIFFEYAYDTAVIAHERGLKNVFVTNGFMSMEAIDKLEDVLDGANIDLKAFSDDFYKTICGGRLDPVKEAIVAMHEKGIWVEVTTLVIPGYNDDPRQIEAIAAFIASIDPGIPWHISAFYPTYRLTDAPPTPAPTLEEARRVGLTNGLKFVYTGNIPGNEGESTYCPGCGRRLIYRIGFGILENLLDNGACPFCHVKIEGRWI